MRMMLSLDAPGLEEQRVKELMGRISPSTTCLLYIDLVLVRIIRMFSQSLDTAS
jgi:hypothetical protein